MKILQANKFFYPFGGSETYFFGLRKMLSDHGHQVIDFSMQDDRNLDSEYSKYFVSPVNYDSKNPLAKLKAAGRLVYSFEAKRKFAKLIKDTQPDIIHLHNIYHQISPSILQVTAKFDIPVVLTTHDLKILCPNYQMFTQGEICERCKVYDYENAIEHRCLKNSKLRSRLVAFEMKLHRKWLKSYRKNIDMLIAPSDFMRNKFIEWRWAKDKIIHLPNFADLYELSNLKVNQDQGDYLVYFGRLSHEKGLETLIRSMALVRSAAKLKIIGSGPQEKELKRLVQRLKLEDKIDFVGFLSGSELHYVVANSRFSVMPSIIYENNPLAVIESLALGRAVIGSDIGGIPELVIDHQTGLNFKSQDSQDLAQKIDYAWSNQDKMNQWGSNGKRMVEGEFNAKKHYQKIMAIYLSLT